MLRVIPSRTVEVPVSAEGSLAASGQPAQQEQPGRLDLTPWSWSIVPLGGRRPRKRRVTYGEHTRARCEGPAPAPLTPELVRRCLAPHISETRKRRIEEVLRRRVIGVTVVLENLYDPHNGAAVLRTCEAMGLFHLHVVEGAEPFFFSRKVSRSAHKWLNIYLHPSAESCLRYLQSGGFCCWAAVPPLGRQADQGMLRPGADQSGLPQEHNAPLALVFGNEHAGLSDQALSCCDRRFSIPMYGFTESLNLSVSVAVTLSSVMQNWRSTREQEGDFARPWLNQLRAAYYAQSTAHASALIMRYLEETLDR